jgi:hypothetical protein
MIDFEYIEVGLGYELTEHQKGTIEFILEDRTENSESKIDDIIEFLGLKYNKRTIVREFVNKYEND